MRYMQKMRGFTLIELLLSVSILTLIAGVSLPVVMSFKNRHDIVVETQSVAEALRRAQQYSATGRGDDTWGVNFQSGIVTVFKGASYAARDTAYDEVDTFPDSLTLSYIGDVVYTKLYGVPSVSGVQTITSQVSGETKNVTLNAKGMVDY